MKKPFYKKWGFWVIVLVIGGIIGIFNGEDDPVDQAAPTTAVEPVQEVFAEVTTQPTAESTAKPTAAPAETPIVVEEKSLPDVPAYEIIFDRLDKSGMWYLSYSTEATDEKELEALFENTRLLWMEQNYKATSAIVDIQRPGDPAFIAKGRIAFSEKGVRQLLMDRIGESEFELIK